MDNYTIDKMLKIKAQAGHKPRGPAGQLGDYVQDLPYRTIATRGSAGQEGTGRGPVSAPTILGPEGEGWTTDDWLKAILEELRRLPTNMSLEWRTRFVKVPREAISFITPSTSVNVPAGTAVSVLSQTIQERYTGFLMKVGVGISPPASSPDITWQIRVNGAVHPEFSNRIFFANTLATPLPFVFELTQARTLELVAINTGAVDILVQGVFTGWTEFMSTFKEYGATPSSGIA